MHLLCPVDDTPCGLHCRPRRSFIPLTACTLPQAISRKDALSAFTAAAVGVALGVSPALADEAAPAQAEGPPTDWGLTKQYYPVGFVLHLRSSLWVADAAAANVTVTRGRRRKRGA